MQLKLQRSQRAGGVLARTVVFCLDARAEYSPAEAANIGKYKLGGEVVYKSQASRKHLDAMNRHLDRTQSGSAGARVAGLAGGIASFALAKMHLNISVASLGRGHHIECKDLAEMMEAEEALMQACRNIRQYLGLAATFNGSVLLVDFDDNEKIHMTSGTLELEALPPSSAPTALIPSPGKGTSSAQGDAVTLVAAFLRQRNGFPAKLIFVAAAFAIAAFGGFSFASLIAGGLVVGVAFIWAARL